MTISVAGEPTGPRGLALAGRHALEGGMTVEDVAAAGRRAWAWRSTWHDIAALPAELRAADPGSRAHAPDRS